MSFMGRGMGIDRFNCEKASASSLGAGDLCTAVSRGVAGAFRCG